MAANEKKKYLIGPDEGLHLPLLDITHKVIAEDFGGAFTITEASLPPGEMIPPHSHTREDECNFVLEGELTFDVGGEIVLAQVGSFVVKPRGVYHAFCNTGAGPQSAPGNTCPGRVRELLRRVRADRGERDGRGGAEEGKSGSAAELPLNLFIKTMARRCSRLSSGSSAI